MCAYTLRHAGKIGTVAAVFAGFSMISTAAHADVTGGGGPNTSYGVAELRYEHNKGLGTGIETPALKPLGGSDAVAVKVGIKIDPVTNGGPLFVVDMTEGALVEASWGNDKQIVLRAQDGAQTDGLVEVRHTLTPGVEVAFDYLGLKGTYTWNATDLLKYVPGSKFLYDASGSQQFAPWAFGGAATKVTGVNLDQARLFQVDMSVLPGLISENVTGNFGLRATTNPTFTYKTTKISLSGTTGELTNGSDEIVVPARDGDFMEIMASVEGDMDVKGSIKIEPYVYIDQIGTSINLDKTFAFTAYEVKYPGSATKVNFPTALVHIPLPNVRVPKSGVDFGTVRVGSSSTASVVIENTGEMESTMTVSSSDSQFQVPSGIIVMPPKSSYELEVTFSPDFGEAALAEITVLSNDPDSPEQMFKIGANGADVGPDRVGPDGERLPDGGDFDAAGCGCKATGASPVSGWAGLGLGGLGALMLFGRRRRAA